ncbi:MAG: hypothetical protein AAGH90_01025 [Pseudomonadota bacterium]
MKSYAISVCAIAICATAAAQSEVISAKMKPGSWNTVTSGTQVNILNGVAQEPDQIYEAELIEVKLADDRRLSVDGLMVEPTCAPKNINRTSHTVNFDWTCPDSDVAITGRTEAVMATSLDKLTINMTFDISSPKGQSKTNLNIISTLQPTQ